MRPSSKTKKLNISKWTRWVYRTFRNSQKYLTDWKCLVRWSMFQILIVSSAPTLINEPAGSHENAFGYIYKAIKITALEVLKKKLVKLSQQKIFAKNSQQTRFCKNINRKCRTRDSATKNCCPISAPRRNSNKIDGKFNTAKFCIISSCEAPIFHSVTAETVLQAWKTSFPNLKPKVLIGKKFWILW